VSVEQRSHRGVVPCTTGYDLPAPSTSASSRKFVPCHARFCSPMALFLGARSMPDTASASRLALGPQPRAYHGTNFRLEALVGAAKRAAKVAVQLDESVRFVGIALRVAVPWRVAISADLETRLTIERSVERST